MGLDTQRISCLRGGRVRNDQGLLRGRRAPDLALGTVPCVDSTRVLGHDDRMNDWYGHNQRRRAQKVQNRRDWNAGHKLRKQPRSYPGRGEKFVECGNGAFGNLLGFDRERYDEYAVGTDGTQT